MKIKKNIDLIYLIALGATIGGVLTLGIVMTSTIFHSQNYVGDMLTHFQEGKIMAQAFAKFNYFLGFMAVFILVYEMYAYKILQRDKTVMLSSLVVLGSIALFVGVYSPKIIALQKAGESVVTSEEFINLHKASEIDFKLLVVGLLVLMGRRLYVLLNR